MRKTLLFLLLFLLSASAFSQGHVITGQMVDEKGKPVPFVSVSVRNPVSGQNENGVSADEKGNFRIEAKNCFTAGDKLGRTFNKRSSSK